MVLQITVLELDVRYPLESTGVLAWQRGRWIFWTQVIIQLPNYHLIACQPPSSFVIFRQNADIITDNYSEYEMDSNSENMTHTCIIMFKISWQLFHVPVFYISLNSQNLIFKMYSKQDEGQSLEHLELQPQQ